MYMDWSPAPFQAHCQELSKALSRQAFWKTALFGVLLLERQRPVYERLAMGRPWGAVKEVRQVLDRLWKGVLTGVRLDDKFLLALEENPVEPREQPWDPAAACTVEDTLHLIHVFRRKGKKAAGELAERNLRCLCLCLSACGEDCVPEQPQLAAELAYHRELCRRLCEVPNKEKASFLVQCRKEDAGSLLGDRWFPDYPDYPPLKRKAKKLPALRYTHVRYDDYVEKVKQPGQDGLNAWEGQQRDLALYNTWLTWPNQMPNDCDIQHPLIQHVVRRWPMPGNLAEIYDYFSLTLRLAARPCWACTEDPEQVRGLFWLSARAQEACYALLEKGWPCSLYLAYLNSMHKYLPGPAFYAMCAGDWDLAERMLKRWHRPLKLRGKPAPWRKVPVTRVWLALLLGDDEQVRFLMEKGTQGMCPPTNDECLWPQRYPWNGWEEDCETFRMLLEEDKRGLEKTILKDIRSIRTGYEQDLATLVPYDLVLWKLARRRGVALDLPPVSEMPAALLEDKLLDAEKWKLPGQAILDEALGPQGMELLAKWTLLSISR